MPVQEANPPIAWPEGELVTLAYTCRRCGKLFEYRNITWADGPHRGERVRVEELEIRPGGAHPIKLFICPVCMSDFEAMYQEWLEKKP